MRDGSAQAIRSGLEEAQNSDGGWGAYPGTSSATEPSAWAVLALSHPGPEGPGEPTLAGRDWLRRQQLPDGSWPHSPGVPESRWATAPAVLALSGFEEDREAVLAAGTWLLSNRARGLPWLLRARYLLFPDQEATEMDAGLTGWPWYPGTFSWVEPTASALLALKIAFPDRSGLAARRIAEGEQLLFDRVCPGGGWNYGNTVVLGEELWPYPDTTALALIALQDLGEHPAVSSGLERLIELVEENGSGLATALGVLCLRLYGRDARRLAHRLGTAHERNGFLGETRVLSLAALALGSGPPPLAIPRSPGRSRSD